MTTTQEPTQERIKYGNYRMPEWKGLFGLSPGMTVAAFVAVVGALVLMFVRAWWLLLIYLVLVVLVAAPLTYPFRKGPLYQRLGRRRANARARRKGHAQLRQGPAGHVPDGLYRAPGMAAATQLTAHRTAYGDEFGMITWNKPGLHTVVINAFPEGVTGLDQDYIDNMVANWGAFLNMSSLEMDVVQVQAVIETAPDSGVRLKRSASRGLVADRPEISRVVLEESLAGLGQGSSDIKSWCAITFDGKGQHGSERRPISEVARDLAARLPHILGDFRTTGGGDEAVWCTAQELTDDLHVAFNPSNAHHVERDRSREGGTGLTWKEIGPTWADEHLKRYVLNGARTFTQAMVNPPRAPHTEELLEQLLAPHRDVPRKRVAVLYRPENPERSMEAAERQVNQATFGASQKSRLTGRNRMDVNAALKTEEEEAEGALLQRFAIAVTCTTFSAEEEQRARRAISTLTKRARLKMRWQDGSHAAAFLMTLPMGMVPTRHKVLPEQVREVM